MRKRFQYGSITRRGDSWVAQWWEGDRRRKQVLGRKPEMTKTQAQAALAAILLPLNAGHSQVSQRWSFGEFVRQAYLSFYRRKWKRSTALTNQDRIKNHLYPEFDTRKVGSFGREELQ